MPRRAKSPRRFTAYTADLEQAQEEFAAAFYAFLQSWGDLDPSVAMPIIDEVLVHSVAAAADTIEAVDEYADMFREHAREIWLRKQETGTPQ